MQVAAARRIAVAAGIGEEGQQGAQAIDLRGVDQAAPLPGRCDQRGLVQRAEVEGQRRGRHAEPRGDVTGGESARPGREQDAQQIEARLLAQGGEGESGGCRFHNSTIIES